MAHEQGNQPGDDPSKFGLKFDSEKPRWGLLPYLELISIVKHFSNKDLDLTSELNRENIINTMFTSIISYRSVKRAENRYETLSMVAFKMFLLLRGEPYTEEELARSTCNLRWDLLNMKDLEGVVNVFTKGARKYADNNWMKVSIDRYYDALIRHFNTLRTAERYDSELGCLHAYQVIWNLMALMWLENQIPETIKSTAQKLKGTPPLKVKLPKEKAAKKKVVKRAAKKK